MFDPHFRVEVVQSTPNPNQLCYVALHQDYSEGFGLDEPIPDERRCGQILVERCVKFGHWGVTEHPAISFNVGGFPHSVMQQARTHRIGITFDVQSFRYSGQRIADVGQKISAMESSLIENPELLEELKKVFYLRPVGTYTDRQGKHYDYTADWQYTHTLLIAEACVQYWSDTHRGMAEEHARGLIPFDVRQNFVVTCNARSLMHFLDLRAKKDAQLEIQVLSQMLFEKFKLWMPELAEYYEEKRLHKARLSP